MLIASEFNVFNWACYHLLLLLLYLFALHCTVIIVITKHQNN